MRAGVCLLVVLAAALCASYVQADVYIQSPRGSNNRYDEANRERNNGDRMFDSQNNNRGGYNVGQVYFYTGSTVSFEWTAQHSCGDKTRMNCELILQYTCDDRLRDGTTTATIPTNPNQCYDYDCDTDLRFGRHESFNSYQRCRFTSRNRGLFLSSQNLNGQSQRNTRQNPGGTRRGYECPEERDYYPYWQPTIWRDIAVLTNDPKRCHAYQAESQNVKGKSYCEVPAGLWEANAKQNKEGWIPLRPETCETLSFKDVKLNQTFYGKWVTQPAWDIPAPVCRENQWSRDNHHGNVAGTGGFTASYNWTVPDTLIHERCAFRLRYNISTQDTVEWNNSTIQAGFQGDFLVNARPSQGRKNVIANRDPALTPVWERYKLTRAEVEASFQGFAAEDTKNLRLSREYVLKNNPRVDIFGSLFTTPVAVGTIKTQLAINTAQYGRTFQDRTHRFAIRRRPANIPADATIWNLQVRGKRGNIVQTYPGVEYDFTPNRLHMQQGDFIHFQWTGSNTNPNDAGQGLGGSDRSNVVGMRVKEFNDGQRDTIPMTKGSWGNSYPTRIDDSIPFLGLSKADQAYLGTLQSLDGMVQPGGQFGGSMDQFNDAGTYFDLGPRQITQAGIYHYICTRNNAFSNRSQKGKIVVSNTAAATQAIGMNGGTIQAAGGQQIYVPEDTFTSLQVVTAAVLPRSADGVKAAPQQKSDFLDVQFDETALADGKVVEFTMNYDSSPLHIYTLKRASSPEAGDWVTVDATFSGGQVHSSTTTPGTYAVRGKLDGGAVAGIVIGCVVFIVAVVLIVYFVYKRNAGKSLGKNTSHTKNEVNLSKV